MKVLRGKKISALIRTKNCR